MADQPPSPTPPADASAQQRLDLTLRLLAAQFHVANDQLRLSTGALPDDLPFALPLPDGARILGALTNASPNPDAWQATILVEAPMTVEQGARAFSERLEAHGWSHETRRFGVGGFVHVMPGISNFLRFWTAASDFVLFITSEQDSGSQPTTFSIGVRQERQSPRRRPDAIHDLQELIPPLWPPAGSTQQGGGGGGGDQRRYATANLTTDAPIAAVMANYDRQLESGGWQRRSGGANGSIGWSFWSLTDKEGAPWRGALVAISDPDRPRDYLAFVQIESDSAYDGGFTGWQSHSILKG